MTGPMSSLLLAALLFVGLHFLLSSTRLRDGIAGAIGEYSFLALYSVQSFALLFWMVAAYRDAPDVELWPATTFARHLAMTVMALACVLLVGGYTAPNPTAVGMEKLAARPPVGVLAITRHPVMWAIGLWAIVHALANGDVASLILFGALAVLALGGTLAIDRKKARRLGAAWPPLAAATSNLPFAALIGRRADFRFADLGWWRLALAAALYLALYYGHRPLFGVAPLPG